MQSATPQRVPETTFVYSAPAIHYPLSSMDSLANRVMDGLAALRRKEQASIDWTTTHLPDGEPLEGESTGRIIGTATELQKQRLCQAHLMAGPKGLKENPESPLRSFDSWANASDGKHLLEQLTITPFLIVDVKATKQRLETEGETDAYCVNNYGVTMDQLFYLAREGFIGFNLMSFDSEQRTYFSKYRRSELAARILEGAQDGEMACWITSMRRKAFFDRISDRPYQELLDEAESAIEAPGRRFFDKVSDKGDAGNPDARWYILNKLRHKGKRAVTASKHHYAYLRACGSNQVQERLDDLVNGEIDAEDFGSVAYELRGLKTAYATRYSSSLGAQYRMSHSAYLTCTERVGLCPAESMQEILQEELTAFIRRRKIIWLPSQLDNYFAAHVRRVVDHVAERLQGERGRHGEGEGPGWTLQRFEGALPRPLDDNVFAAYVSQLKQGTEERALYNNLLNEITRSHLSEGTLEEMNGRLDNIMDVHQDVEESLFEPQQQLNRFRDWLGDAIATGGAALQLPLQVLLNMGSVPGDDVVSQCIINGVLGFARYPVQFGPSPRLYEIRNKNAVHYHLDMARLESFARRRP